jgi:hypothetical protein
MQNAKCKVQNAKCKMQKNRSYTGKKKFMRSFFDGMSDRFMVFVVNIINLEKQLCKTYSGRHIYGQLFRAGTSAGANYEEARAGEKISTYKKNT